MTFEEENAHGRRIAEEIKNAGYDVSAFMVGSRVTCDPPPRDTDCDILVFAARSAERDGEKSSYKLVEDYLLTNGYKPHPRSKEYSGLGGFTSYRNGIYNVILTGDTVLGIRFNSATRLAKKLNLLEKQQRVGLFRYMLYGVV